MSKRWVVGVACMVCLGCGAAVSAQEVALDTSLELQTTYIFRGEPQYKSLESPNLQLRAIGTLPQGPGEVWLDAQVISTLAERNTNERRGSADEVNLRGGYRWDLSRHVRLGVGGVVYLRPHNDPVDLREEAVGRLELRLGDRERGLLIPYVAAYGEVHRLLGVYGEGGVLFIRDLGEGIDLVAHARGGAAWYQEVDSRFNHGAFSVEMGYRPIEWLRVGGRVSAALTQNNIDYSDSFWERHTVVWSGLLVEYSPPLR